ncbi:septum site-determining protein MinC [Roseateles koreensis]|uniref:Probable septum site-determining protein MinC n=1 Tax=Roseateles koreensis TaxID=2987526 RepID=A0ABT5KRA4_9BURK|nr:septum site-determining protein MinC [Roseateles koreensis]MDC8784312.1 septum site-determining protein MinC [Roseateles koreensis]
MGRAAARTGARHVDCFELKSANLSALALVLKSADLEELALALAEKFGDTPDVFSQEPLLLDFSHVPRAAHIEPLHTEPTQLSLGQADEPLARHIDIAALVALLHSYRLQAVAVLGATPEELAQALSLGLAEAPPEDGPRHEAPHVVAPAQDVVREVIREVVREVRVEVPVPAEGGVKTLIIDKPLRSGQQVYAKGGDLVVLALVNHGAEVIADGSIHVYAPLRGKAIAGARGNTEARIFAMSMEAELIAIAGTYRTTENPLPDTVLGKAAQIRLDGEKLVMEALTL